MYEEKWQGEENRANGNRLRCMEDDQKRSGREMDRRHTEAKLEAILNREEVQNAGARQRGDGMGG